MTIDTLPSPAEPVRALVTGGSGFIGTNLVESLLADRVPVLNFDMSTPRNSVQNDVHFTGNLLDLDSLRRALREFMPTQVYHLAARTDLWGNSVSDYDANTDGVRNLLRACADTPSIKRIVFTSSKLVCEMGYEPKNDTDYHPASPYGESKAEGERIVRANAGDYTWAIVRPTSIWGPWFDVPYRLFFNHVRAGRYVHPGKLKVPKSFGYVGNAVFQLRSLMACAPAAIHRKTFYLCDYAPLDLREFADEVSMRFGRGPVRAVPLALLKAAANAGDLLQKLGYREPPLTNFRLNNLCASMTIGSWGLDVLTGPLPYSMASGVADTVQWMMRDDRVTA